MATNAEGQDPIEQEIKKARVKMIMNKDMGFFGNVAIKLVLKDATKWCSTITTDGRYLYYNREFIKSLKTDELVFIIAHTILHCAYDHLGRRGNRDKTVWDAATDYQVNYTLVKNDIGQIPDKAMYSEKFTDEMSAEEIYLNLLEKYENYVQPSIDEHLDLGDDDGDDSKGKTKSNKSGEPDNESGDSSSGNSEGQDIQVNAYSDDGPPSLSEEELDEIRKEIMQTILESAYNAGNAPSPIMRMIEEFKEPKLDWRELLEVQINSSIIDDYTYTKLSSVTWSSGCVIPGHDKMKTIDVVCVIDVSGSIDDEKVTDFLSEVKSIMETFEDFNLEVFCFDTNVHKESHKIFKPDNIDELNQYETPGGGGTDFEVVFEYMRENDIDPNILVFFTDGLPHKSWGDPNYCDTLFIIHNEFEKVEPPFGNYAYYDNEKDKKK